MTEQQFISELGRVVGMHPEAAHQILKEVVTDYLKENVSHFAAQKFEAAMEWALPPQSDSEF